MPQVSLNTRIELETLTNLKAYAKEKELSQASVVDKAISEYLKREMEK